MDPGVALILLTKLDSKTFLPLAREVLGYSPASAADSVTTPLKELAHSAACIASFKDKDVSPHLSPTAPSPWPAVIRTSLIYLGPEARPVFSSSCRYFSIHQ